MAGISSKAAGKLENKKNKFQNQEFNDDLGVNYYEFRYRNHDPQIGRFIQIDPLADEYVYNSTYAFSENKVTGHIELEGLEAVDVRSLIEKGIRQTSPNASEKDIARVMKSSDDGQVKGGLMVLSWLKIAGIGALMFSQPEIGIPLALSELSGGAPVLPAPQAMSGMIGSQIESAVVRSEKQVINSSALELAGSQADESLTLFRGVNSDNVHFKDALKGVVKPNGGNASPLEHNQGNTLNSPYTSWTTDPIVATNYAMRGSGSGVVLKANVPASSTVVSPNLKMVNLVQKPGTVVSESEVLVNKTITNASAIPVKK